MKIKGVERERKRLKKIHGMRVDGDIRRVQLALLYSRYESFKNKKTSS